MKKREKGNTIALVYFLAVLISIDQYWGAKLRHPEMSLVYNWENLTCKNLPCIWTTKSLFSIKLSLRHMCTWRLIWSHNPQFYINWQTQVHIPLQTKLCWYISPLPSRWITGLSLIVDHLPASFQTLINFGLNIMGIYIYIYIYMREMGVARFALCGITPEAPVESMKCRSPQRLLI